VENSCGGVAGKGGIPAPLRIIHLFISSTYLLETNGSFDTLPGRVLSELGGISLTDKEISAR